MNASNPSTNQPSPKSPLMILRDEWRDGQQSIHLRVNDRLQFEIKDAGSFRLLCGLLERLENIRAIQAGLDDFEAGRVMDLDEFKQHICVANKGIPS